MPVLAEKVIIPLLVAAIAAFALVNPVGLDWTWRIGSTFVLLLVAALIALWLHARSRSAQQQKPIATPTPTAPRRIYIKVDPAVLSGFYNEHTQLQASKLLETYVGKWIRISGSVMDVEMSVLGKIVVFLSTENMTRPLMALYFEPQWAEHTTHLRRGASIVAEGQIGSAGRDYLTLANCELVNGRDPSVTFAG